MADVAQLGIAVDTSGLKAGSDQLRVFESVAKRTGETVEQVQARFAALAVQHGKTAETTNRVATSTGLARHELINLSRQIQDVGVSLASGQSPFIVLVQQGAQIADIFGSSKTGSVGGAMKQVGSVVLGAITPFRALMAITVASGAAAYAAFNSWKDYALKIDDVARVSGLASRSMSALTSAAAFKGISNDEFLGEFRKFSLDVEAAKDGVGSLAMQFRFMGQSIGTPQQAFEKIADAVKRAGSDQERIQILQNAGLPITRQWIDLMSKGADGIREAQKAATSFGGTINDDLVLKARAFGEEWNKLAENIKLWFRNVFVNLSQGIDSLVTGIRQKMIEAAALLPASIRPDIAGNLMKGVLDARAKGYNVGGTMRSDSSVDQFYSFGGAPGSKSANDNGGGETDEQRRARTLRATIEQNNRYSQSIGILGDLATTEQLVSARSAELANQFLQTGAGAGKMRDAVMNAVRAQSDMSRVQQQAQVGVFDLAAANRAASETIQYWKDKGLITNAEQFAAAQTVAAKMTRDLADAAKVAASNFPQLTHAINQATDIYKQIDQVATSAMGTLTTGIVDVLDGTKSLKAGFADTAKSVIRSIEEMIVKMYILAPIMNSIKSGFGSFLGGGTGSATGVGTNLGNAAPIVGSAKGNIFDHSNIIPFARGGIVNRPTVFPFARGVGLMGEAGPEAILPLRRGPDGRLGVSGPGGGRGDVNVTVINQSSQPVTATHGRMPNGDPLIVLRDAVRGMVADDAANNGPMSKALLARAGGFNGR